MCGAASNCSTQKPLTNYKMLAAAVMTTEPRHRKTLPATSTGLVSSLGVAAIVSLNAASFPHAVEAAIYKCVETDGSTSYRQTPCASEAQQAKVLGATSSNKETLDCRIANNFARKTAVSMRMGSTSGDVFSSYGGIDAVPNTAIGVINYVYTHKDNVDTTPNRIAALSAARCSAGSYGAVDCDDFPYSFISELGGCDTATSSTLASKPSQETSQESAVGPQALGVRTVPADKSADSPTSKEHCKKDLAEQMSQLFAQMRSGQSASQQSALEKKKGALNKQLSGC